MSVHPSDITSSVSELRLSAAMDLNGIKSNKAPMIIETNVLQIEEYV
jgi:hypothetical protein